MNGTNPTRYALNILAIVDDFYILAVTIDRALTPEEVQQVSGCIGYGLTRLAGESLSDPVTVITRAGQTTITYWYDTTKARSENYGVETALADAARYIVDGTPIRRTDRNGPAGTRLIEGIGPCSITFRVDVDVDQPDPTPPAGAALDPLAELNAARDALNAAQQAYAAAAIRYAGAGL